MGKNNNTNLILEDYEIQFSYKKSKSNLNISFNRVAFIFFVFLIVSLIFSSKAIYLGSFGKEGNKPHIIKSDYRSSIIDRDRNILAKTVITTNVGINPNLVINKKKLLINLKLIFPNKDYKKIEKKLNGEKFFYLQKRISQNKFEELILLGDKSIIPEEKISRIYPQGSLFSHIIGQIDNDNNGISGIEKFYDYELRKNDEPIQLTVDTDIQYLIREGLIKSKEIFNNLGSAALLMNINTGEVISLVSLPDFDLNKRETIDDLNYTNKVTKGVYELGSVFKTLTLAAAFENNIVEPETFFEKLGKKIYCAGNVISEYDNKLPANLTAEQILVRSSNIGSVRIAQKVGLEKYKSFLNKLGILNKIEFDLEEVGQPLNFRWGKCKLATSSFGHGIATTPLQLAKAYSIISNGGYEINPSLIKKEKKNIQKKKILKNNVSKKINPILRKVVSTKEGTASFANISGYEIAGKTGTADKVKNGIYTKDKINTFVSIFPFSNPKFILLVLLDEPKPNKEYTYTLSSGQKYKGNWRNTAGWTTVLISGQIIKNIGPILATKY
jgi:cell division protein FtsI (penicillin-binding protein 3)|tara:strand:+ start:1822 stop:3486 length:1665 start_codon:yes stop_codon:yes gene_type:complete